MIKRKHIYIAIFAVVAIASVMFSGCLQSNPHVPSPNVEPLNFIQDTRNQTLIVSIAPVNHTLQWDNVTIDQGTGILPVGTIKVGDKITECRDHVVLTIRYNSSFFSRPGYEFRTAEEELVKFIGTWNENNSDVGKIDNYQGTFTFNTDGTFLKNQTGFSPVIGTWELEYKNYLPGHNYIDNDLMLALYDVNTTVYTYWINEYEDGRNKLMLSLEYYNTGDNEYTFRGASLIKQ